jgi:hypothetical protein
MRKTEPRDEHSNDMANLPSYGEARKGAGKIRKLKRKAKIRVSKYIFPPEFG